MSTTLYGMEYGSFLIMRLVTLAWPTSSLDARNAEDPAVSENDLNNRSLTHICMINRDNKTGCSSVTYV